MGTSVIRLFSVFRQMVGRIQMFISLKLLVFQRELSLTISAHLSKPIRRGQGTNEQINTHTQTNRLTYILLLQRIDFATLLHFWYKSKYLQCFTLVLEGVCFYLEKLLFYFKNILILFLSLPRTQTHTHINTQTYTYSNTHTHTHMHAYTQKLSISRQN